MLMYITYLHKGDRRCNISHNYLTTECLLHRTSPRNNAYKAPFPSLAWRLPTAFRPDSRPPGGCYSLGWLCRELAQATLLSSAPVASVPIVMMIFATLSHRA